VSDIPAVTVAVVVKDRADLMAACLWGIEAQCGPSFEIVIIDNESRDGTWELLVERSEASGGRLRVRREAGSVGRVRNVALAEARAPVIAYVDSDCVPEPGWLAAGVQALGADAGIGVVQGRTRPDPSAASAPWPATQDIDRLSGAYEACNIFYRTDVLRRAGGFDEEIGFFGEDTSAGWSVLRLGYRAAFAGDAVVDHAVSHPGIAWHLRRALLYWKWNRLVRRFPEMREQLLWHRLFLRPRSAWFFASVVALAAGTRRPVLALGAVPYLWWRRPRRLAARPIVNAAGAVGFDAAVCAALVVGTIRERTIVL
jgi:glycosyltransferase involved in cell wall biosynthesis